MKHPKALEAKQVLDAAVAWWGSLTTEERDVYGQITNGMMKCDHSGMQHLVITRPVIKAVSLVLKTGMAVFAATRPDTASSLNKEADEYGETEDRGFGRT